MMNIARRNKIVEKVIKELDERDYKSPFLTHNTPPWTIGIPELEKPKPGWDVAYRDIQCKEALLTTVIRESPRYSLFIDVDTMYIRPIQIRLLGEGTAFFDDVIIHPTEKLYNELRAKCMHIVKKEMATRIE